MKIGATKDITQLKFEDRSAALVEELKHRVLVLDGALGTQIQALGLTESDFRGRKFLTHGRNLAGCNDLLNLTAPDIVSGIHKAYLNAGADLIETNTFNANALSLAEFGLEDFVEEINRRGIEIAKESVKQAGNNAWVVATMGPTGRSLSMASSLDETDKIDWDFLYHVYLQQAKAIVSAKADAVMVETAFDSLNAKAALFALQTAMQEAGIRLPIMISVTLGENGHSLVGQSLDAFIAAIMHASPISVGLNCGFGVSQLAPYVKVLGKWPFAISFHPNAGLPDELGHYTDSAQAMCTALRPLLESRSLNIVGGCCGTTPEHIRAIAELARRAKPHIIPRQSDSMMLSGMELTELPATGGAFTMIGERCNVAGSRKFLRLIKEGSYNEALEIARAQVLAGAKIIDVNFDDAMIDASAEMIKFLELMAEDSVTAKVPVMIDSGSWEVIVEGMKHLRGRGIVNSISLKEGEDEFVKRACHIRAMGCVAVIMAMDESSQADTFERKMEVARRQYAILTQQCGYAPSDIIFDPNVLAVATGIPEHDIYAKAFINAAAAIKREMPGVHVSGGISNLSFAFRGNNTVREAMHSLLIELADGMDIGIVNPSAIKNSDSFDSSLTASIRSLLMADSPDASTRLIELASDMALQKALSKEVSQLNHCDRGEDTLTPDRRLIAKVISGRHEGLEEPIHELSAAGMSALQIVDGPLMEAMNETGTLFSENKIFLPQVVRAARAMKHAVEILAPHIGNSDSEGTERSRKPRVVLATVKGDVHDIGKNIVAIVLRCNGFEVEDLGVMVPAETIVEHAKSSNADIVALSGLITPSLHEMQQVANAMEAAKLNLPLFVGGAATSELHTAVKIAPEISTPVFHTVDASQMPAIAKAWMSPATRETLVAETNARYELLRNNHRSGARLMTIEQADAHSYCLPANAKCMNPLPTGCKDYHFSVVDIEPLINWRAFISAWGLEASLAEVAQIGVCEDCRAQWLDRQPQEMRAKAVQAIQLINDAKKVLADLKKYGAELGLKARIVTLEAVSSGGVISARVTDGTTLRLPMLRQQTFDEGKQRLSLADFVLQPTSDDAWPDKITFFAVTGGDKIAQLINDKRANGDDYEALLLQSIADRLAEATTEHLHRSISLLGIRPAIGYASMPDQSIVFEADKALKYEEIGITITDRGALYPQASTTGIMLFASDARYFTVGAIGADQFERYAAMRDISPSELLPYIWPRIAYSDGEIRNAKD